MASEVAKNVGGTTIGHSAVGSGGGASVTYGSMSGDSRISQEYNHLMMIWVVKTANTSDPDNQMNMKLNNDTGTNYNQNRMAIISSNINSFSYDGQTAFTLGNFTGSGGNVGGGSWGGGIIWMPYYSSTEETKALWLNNAGESESTGSNQFRMSKQSWLYDSTSAITQIDFWPYGYNFKEGCTITLYGLT